MLFVDQETQREWCIGTVKQPLVLKKLIILPIHAHPMYPRVILDPSTDYIYCVCAKCDQPISEELGLVALEFSAVSWGVRIVCTSHATVNVSRMLGMPIINVGPTLQPVIENAFLRDLRNCVVCDRPNCTDDTCQEVRDRGILYKSRIDELMVHFYRTKLDVLSPLLAYCDTCGIEAEERKFVCDTCKLVFCSKACRRRRHKCVPVEDLY